MQRNISEGALRNIGDNPHLLRLVDAFSKYFRTNHAVLTKTKNDTGYSFLYFAPVNDVAEQFSILREVLCFVDDSAYCDSRTFDLIDDTLKRQASRLVDDVLFFVSEAGNAAALCADYMERRGRKVIQCTWHEIEAAHEDFSYELLRQFLYNRNFFDISDPVSTDAQFFARYKLVDEIYDSLLAGQNTGIFGLRKIGKTSVLERLIKRNALANKFRIANIDAQSPEIYANDAGGVALEICREFNRSWATEHGVPFQRDVPRQLSLIDSSRFFRDFVRRLAQQNKPLLVVIDELERILPSQSRASNWNTDYIDLWRLLRSESQTMDGKFVFLVASTNPYFIESAKFADEDNPIYRFIKTIYLSMFDLEELSEMLRKLGKPMGISFSDEALSVVHSEFGGHPFLSRQLCSAVAKDLAERPLSVESRHISRSVERHRTSFREDIKAILKIFADFYPDERALLDQFCRDERSALRALQEQPLAAKHLVGYGLLSRTRNSYRFTMNALPEHLCATPLPEFTQPELPDSARARHLQLQTSMNLIEPALRSLVVAQLRGQFGREWQANLNLQESSKQKIELLGAVSSQIVMEETFITDLISTIGSNWQLFAKVFESRDQFKEHSRHLSDIARKASDHRKLSVCSDDSKYIRASEACNWFIDKVG